MQIRQRVCNDLSFGVRIRILDKILDTHKHGSFRLIDSKTEFYGIVFNERVRVKIVPLGLIHTTPQVLNAAETKYQNLKNPTIQSILYSQPAGLGQRSVRLDVDKILQRVHTRLRRAALPDSHSSSWKEPYLAALREPDHEKLTNLIHATELAMFLRTQELAQLAGDNYEELNEIEGACTVLLTVKTQILAGL